MNHALIRRIQNSFRRARKKSLAVKFFHARAGLERTTGDGLPIGPKSPPPVIPSGVRSDFRTPVESIGLQKPENLLVLFFTAKADPSCRLSRDPVGTGQQGLQVEI